MTYTLNMGKTPFKLNEIHATKSFLQHNSIPIYDKEIVVIDGPFYANGSLHLGHFANKVLKDAIVRTHNLIGIKSRLQITSDQHGLPIEIEVEKKYGKDGDFVANCRTYANEQFAAQLEQVKDFGILYDDRTIATSSFDYEAYEMEKLHKLYKDGKLVRLLRPVHFCSACNSSLAEAEVEHNAKESPSLTVKFPIGGKTYLLVWTTTPYTLFFNKAVAYNPKFTYVMWQEGDEYFVTLKEMAESLGKEYTIFNMDKITNDYPVVSPITNDSVPLLVADYVESSGTGLVHIAPNFGIDDYRVGVKYDLEIVDCIDNKGIFNNAEPIINGMNIKQASEAALNALNTKGLVYKLEKVSHNVGHCWRHKMPLFFKASKEWFLDLADIPSLYEKESYKFFPPNSANRLKAMIDSRKLWCISRNRKWGVPLPFFYDENDNVVDDEQLIKTAIDNVRHGGVETWHKQSTQYTPSNQVADVWLDSGILYDYYKHTYGVHNVILAEGSDQHRGWFNSTICTNLLLGNVNSNLNIFTHGFVVDEKGLKLSKSNKNYVELSELFKKYSPDLLRLLVLSQNIHQDIVYSKGLIDQTTEKYKKIRNTFRFVLQNYSTCNEFELVKHHGAKKLFTEIDTDHDIMNIIRHKLNNLIEVVKESYTELNYQYVCKEIFNFANEVSVYFDTFKDILYCNDKYDIKRYSLCVFLKQIADMYAYIVSIIMPFTAQEYWDLIGNTGCVNDYAVKFKRYMLPKGIDALMTEYEKHRSDVNARFELVKTDEHKQLSQFEFVTSSLGAINISPNTIQLSSMFGVASVKIVHPVFNDHLRPYANSVKCPRCWNYHIESEGLCNRCESVENNLIKGNNYE